MRGLCICISVTIPYTSTILSLSIWKIRWSMAMKTPVTTPELKKKKLNWRDSNFDVIPDSYFILIKCSFLCVHFCYMLSVFSPFRTLCLTLCLIMSVWFHYSEVINQQLNSAHLTAIDRCIGGKDQLGQKQKNKFCTQSMQKVSNSY